MKNKVEKIFSEKMALLLMTHFLTGQKVVATVKIWPTRVVCGQMAA